jgi:hypothetical protein
MQRGGVAARRCSSGACSTSHRAAAGCVRAARPPTRAARRALVVRASSELPDGGASQRACRVDAQTTFPRVAFRHASRALAARRAAGGAERLRTSAAPESPGPLSLLPPPEAQREAVQSFLYPDPEELPDGAPRRAGGRRAARRAARRADTGPRRRAADVQMTIWDHLEELRDRAAVSAGAVGVLVLGAFCFSKQLVLILERPVADQARHPAPRARVTRAPPDARGNLAVLPRRACASCSWRPASTSSPP